MEWSEIRDIVYDVIEITRDRQVKWDSYFEDGVPVYMLFIGIGKICISRQYESMDDEYDYMLEIYNNTGYVIYSCATEYGDRIIQNTLKELYEEAENSSLQRQATINSIKEEILKIKSQII